MSEPMSSTEIEDVLSSIRRLVSDDMRPVSRAPSVAVANAESGKLILTPALRVVQDNAKQTAPTTAEPMPVFVATRRVHLVDEPEAPFIEAEPAPIEQVVATLGAAVTAIPQDWEPEQGDEAPEPALASDGWDMPQAAFFVDQPVWQDLEPMAFVPVEPPAPEVVPSAPEAAAPAWAQEEDEIAADDTDDAPAEVVHGTIEPDPEWADAAEASVIASLQAEADNAQARQSNAADDESDDDTLRFNEDVLRELVRDILREELAGQMGERITRNIRKLVRAEIALITATRALE